MMLKFINEKLQFLPPKEICSCICSFDIGYLFCVFLLFSVGHFHPVSVQWPGLPTPRCPTQGPGRFLHQPAALPIRSHGRCCWMFCKCSFRSRKSTQTLSSIHSNRENNQCTVVKMQHMSRLTLNNWFYLIETFFSTCVFSC